MRKLLFICQPLFALFLFSSDAFSQPPSITFQSFITGLSTPIDIVNANDGTNRLFIVQQGGIIKVRHNNTTSDFINLSSIISTGGERGLLSMAFHPNFTTNRYFFVYYTNTSGDIEISRFQANAVDPNIADFSTRTIIITIPHPTNTNHNGGKLLFGQDGYLYFATGDGGGANDGPNNAQNGNSLLGKMLRIDINTPGPVSHPNYSIPPSNPYISNSATDLAIADEIWNLGLRNPFRWSFDRATGDMWIGDVGQDAREEVDYRPAGSTGHNNFGWRCYEGYISTPGVADCNPPDNVYPVFNYANPSPGSAAITGGYVYRGNEYTFFRGYYMATDVYSGRLYFLWPNGSGGFDSSNIAGQTGLAIVAFGEAEDGTLYAVSQGTNTIYKVVPSGFTPLPLVLQSLRVQHFNSYNEVKWSTSSEQNISKFFVEYSTDKIHFEKAGEVMASRNSNGSNYYFQHQYATIATTFYRLAIIEDDGSIRYSSILKVNANANAGIKVYPSLIKNGILNISSSVPANKLQLINSSGAVVFEKSLGSMTGSAAINLPTLAKGFYIVRVNTSNGIANEKIQIQ